MYYYFTGTVAYSHKLPKIDKGVKCFREIPVFDNATSFHQTLFHFYVTFDHYARNRLSLGNLVHDKTTDMTEGASLSMTNNTSDVTRLPLL